MKRLLGIVAGVFDARKTLKNFGVISLLIREHGIDGQARSSSPGAAFAHRNRLRGGALDPANASLENGV